MVSIITTDSATNGRVASELLTGLFTAVLQFRSASPADAVVDALDQGAYIGSGDGTVEGNEVRGTVSWSLYAGDCLYPLIRAGQSVTEDLHLCTLNPGGFICAMNRFCSESARAFRAFSESTSFALSSSLTRTQFQAVLGDDSC